MSQSNSTSLTVGLLPEAARIWNQAEEMQREKSLQKSLSQLNSSTAVISVEEGSELDEIQDADNYDDTGIGDKSSIINIGRFDLESRTSAKQVPHGIPGNKKEEYCIHPHECKSSLPVSVGINPVKEDEFHRFLRIQSLEFQVEHLINQNRSLHNVIDQSRKELETLSMSEAQAVENLRLLKSQFLHLLPPPSLSSLSDNDGDESILPNLSDLRGDILHQSQVELNKARNRLRLQTNELERTKQESRIEIEKLKLQNRALSDRIQSLECQSFDPYCTNEESGTKNKLIKEQDEVKRQHQQQVNSLQDQISTLIQQRKEAEEKEDKKKESITKLKEALKDSKILVSNLRKERNQFEEESKALIEEINSLRGQLDEISGNINTSSASHFQEEISNLQTLLTQSQVDYNESVTTIKCKNKKIMSKLQQSKQKEDRLISELKNLKQEFISFIHHLHDSKERSQNNNTFHEMIWYACQKINDKNVQNILQDEIEKIRKTHPSQTSDKGENSRQNNGEIDAQANCAGLTTTVASTKSICENQKFTDQIHYLQMEKEAIIESNKHFQVRLQESQPQFITNSESAVTLNLEVQRLSKENASVLKSNTLLKKENEKLIEKSINIEKRLNESNKISDKYLTDTKKLKKELQGIIRKHKQKTAKLNGDLAELTHERNYWEKKATQIFGGNGSGANEIDKGTTVISFDKPSDVESEVDSASILVNLSCANSNFVPQSKNFELPNFKNINNSITNRSREPDNTVEDWDIKLKEKNVIINALCEHIELHHDKQSYIPLDEWLESWESTMDQHVSETTGMITNALSDALSKLTDEFMTLYEKKKEDEGTHNYQSDADMDTLASAWTVALKDGLDKLFDHGQSIFKNEVISKHQSVQTDGEKLKKKLTKLLENINEQYNFIQTKNDFIGNFMSDNMEPECDSNSGGFMDHEEGCEVEKFNENDSFHDQFNDLMIYIDKQLLFLPRETLCDEKKNSSDSKSDILVKSSTIKCSSAETGIGDNLKKDFTSTNSDFIINDINIQCNKNKDSMKTGVFRETNLASIYHDIEGLFKMLKSHFETIQMKAKPTYQDLTVENQIQRIRKSAQRTALSIVDHDNQNPEANSEDDNTKFNRDLRTMNEFKEKVSGKKLKDRLPMFRTKSKKKNLQQLHTNEHSYQYYANSNTGESQSQIKESIAQLEIKFEEIKSITKYEKNQNEFDVSKGFQYYSDTRLKTTNQLAPIHFGEDQVALTSPRGFDFVPHNVQNEVGCFTTPINDKESLQDTEDFVVKILSGVDIASDEKRFI